MDNIFIDTVAIKIKLANLSFEQLSNQPQGKKIERRGKKIERRGKKEATERFYEIFIAKKKKKKERKLTEEREEKKKERGKGI